MRGWTSAAAIALLGPLILAPRAWGQNETQTEIEQERQGVLQRARPDYDPLGIRLGGFLLYPSLGVGETYDSNVFVTQSAVVSDFFTTLTPAVQLRSDWNRDALNFSVNDMTRRFVTQASESYSNVNVATDGRLDIENNVYLSGGLAYQVNHEDRASPNSLINQKTPTFYQQETGQMAYVHEAGRLGVRFDSSVNSYFYDNNETDAGTPIAESYRNRIEYYAAPRIEYEIIPEYQAFIRPSFNYRDYFTKFSPAVPGTTAALAQNSYGFTIDAGTAIRLGATLNGEVFAGYYQETYADSRLPTGSGPNFGANLLWNVTRLTSVRASASRTIQESIVPGSTTYLQSQGALSVEHEVLRDVLVEGGGSYTVQDFAPVARVDDIYEAHTSLRYLINRNLSAQATVGWSNRNSTAPGNNYDQELVSLSVRTQF
jgi:hypothetical protein